MRSSILFGIAPVAFLSLLIVTIPNVAKAGWAGPDPVLAVGAAEPPAGTSGGPHGVEIVYVGPNKHLYWQWHDAVGNLTAPADLSDVGGASRPALVANAHNRLDAFYQGKNGHLWTSWWDGTWWSAPTDLGGAILGSAPAAVKDGIHKLDVYYLDNTGKLLNSSWDGGPWWSGASAFGIQGVTGPVAAVTGGPHRTEIFYRGTDGRLWSFYSDGGPWSEAKPIGGGVAIVSNPSGASKRIPLKPEYHVDCNTAAGLISVLCEPVAYLFYVDKNGWLGSLESVNHGPWGEPHMEMQIGNITKISAITADDVFFMGIASPNGFIANGTQHVHR